MDVSPLEVGVLGPLVVRVEDEPVTLGDRARAVLLALVARHGDLVGAEALVEVVWPDGPPAGARNSLQAAVSRLRRALGAAGGLLTTEGGGYRLELTDGAVDAVRFEAAVAAARPHAAEDPAAVAGLLADALALWRGDAYVDAADDPVALAEANRLAELRLEAVELQAVAALAAGSGGAQVVARVASDAAEHATREGLQRVHAHALYLAGRQDAALEVLARLERRLREELGLDPDPRTAALQRAILAHDPTLRPPSRGDGRPSASARPPAAGEVPLARTPFVGRASELVELRERLGSSRLVTLVGPGGTGKSRLAMEAARSWREDGGVLTVVELAAVAEPADVLSAVAAAVGVTQPVLVPATPERDAPPERPLAERIAAAVADREVLLVLDNCEHLVDAAAEVVDELLAAAPRLRVLTTSREGLRVHGEALLAVHPLAVPDATVSDPDALLTSEAVELFVDRARAVDPVFVVDAATAPAVREICRRLDGLPLALELAAARVATVPVGLLAQRLSDRFRLLTGGRRTVPRQRTLEAVVAWSYDLLDTRQGAVLRRLGVFAGAPAVELAEMVCAGDPVARADVLGVLAELADKSLLELVADAGDTRVRLLETIRDFAQVRLDAEEDVVAARDRHAAVFVARAADASRGLRGPDQLDWLDRLDREHDDLRAALGWLVDRAPERAVAMAADLAWFWWLHGHSGEGASWLADALDRVRDAPPAEAARAAAWLAFLRLFQSGTDLDAVVAASRQAHALLDSWHDRLDAFDLAACLVTLAYVDLVCHGRLPPGPRGDDLSDAALDAARASGEPWVESAAHFVRAVIATVTGRRDAAMQEAERALGLADHTGDRWARYQTLELLSGMRVQAGDYAQARAGLTAAADLAREMGAVEQVRSMQVQHALVHMLEDDLDAARAELEALLDEEAVPGFLEAFVHYGLGRVADRAGDLDRAVAHHRTAADTLLEERMMRGAAEAPAGIAFARAAQGDGDAASGALDAALALVPEVGHLGATRPLLLEAAAGVALACGDPDLALRRLGRAETLRAAAPLVAGERWHVDRIASAARTRLGAAAADAALAAGRAGEALLPPAD